VLGDGLAHPNFACPSRVTGSVLDELVLDRQAALELKLKAALHQNILQLVKRRGGWPTQRGFRCVGIDAAEVRGLIQVSLRDTVVSWVAHSRQWNWRAIFIGPSGTGASL